MCAICAGVRVCVEGSVFLQGKHYGCGSVNMYTKIITLWDYRCLFDIKDPRSTAKVIQKRNTHGFNFTQPLTDADGYL